VNRPDSPEVFYEDCLMALAYYGVHALIENQKPGIIHYFERRGYKPFSYFIPGNKEPGIAATNRNNTYISEVTDQFINDHIDTVYFEELIEDWLQFNPEKTTKYDAAMAFGYALTMMVNINFSPDKIKQEAKIEDYLPFFRKSNGKGLFGRY